MGKKPQIEIIGGRTKFDAIIATACRRSLEVGCPFIYLRYNLDSGFAWSNSKLYFNTDVVWGQMIEILLHGPNRGSQRGGSLVYKDVASMVRASIKEKEARDEARAWLEKYPAPPKAEKAPMSETNDTIDDFALQSLLHDLAVYGETACHKDDAVHRMAIKLGRLVTISDDWCVEMRECKRIKLQTKFSPLALSWMPNRHNNG